MNKMGVAFLAALLMLSGISIGQIKEEAQSDPGQTKAEKLANSLKPSDIKKHLQILASDKFEGRETGTEGSRKASEYISAQLENFGLATIPGQDDYFQRIEFTWSKWEDIYFTSGENEYKHLRDFIANPGTISRDILGLNEDQLFFLGYGISDDNYDDYGNFFVQDRVLIVYDGEPVDEDGISQVTGTQELSDWSGSGLKKAQLAMKKGVKLLLIIDDDFQNTLRRNRRRLLGSTLMMNVPGEYEEQACPYMYISSTMAKELLGKKTDKVIKKRDKMKSSGKTAHLKIKTDMSVNMLRDRKVVESPNVIGMIEGTNPEKKDEYVIVSAHYDHLGTRGDVVYNGADDNGSGTSTLLALSRIFASAKSYGIGPERSVVFLWVTGEEKGLLGSSFYVDHPLLPLENAVANVNVDMIGRVDKAHEDNPEYVYVIGADRISTELHEINENANKEYVGIELDYTFNSEDDPNRYYYRSDHYNFARQGIPAIFYFSGVHDDYHQPGDDVNKIMFDKTAKIGQLIFHVIWELANREEVIVRDVQP